MNQKEALTVLVRRHRHEFSAALEVQKEDGVPQSKAKSAVVKLLVVKYQEEYLHLRGKNLKGRL